MILTKFNKIKRRKIIRRWSIGFVSSSIVILTVIALRNHLAQASPLAGFDPGNIMSDSVMSDYQTMTVEQIQNFLNQKMPHCDTYGRKNVTYFYQPSTGRLSFSWFAGAQRVTTTRAVFGERNNKWRNGTDYGVPFTCLRDKVEHGKTAARIIYDVAHKYKINPQVLIVLLQKEQNLVHDDWPQGIQYRTATGYGCPDTAPCAKEYFGLTNQLDWAAKMFRSILNRSSGWYTPYGVGNNRIYWNPNHSCGYSTVNIQNLATAALYSYTPYRPNQAALNAGYGLGDSCSAYGNRNFYLYFKDWFGVPNNDTPKITSTPVTKAKAGKKYQYQIKHTDTEGDHVAFKLEKAPSWLKQRDGLLYGEPVAADVGKAQVEVRVYDYLSATKHQFEIVVAPADVVVAESNSKIDFNKDGYSDIAITSAFADGKTFNLWIFPGGKDGFAQPIFQRTFSANDGWNQAKTKFFAGDANGDGFGDLTMLVEKPDGGIDIHQVRGSKDYLKAKPLTLNNYGLNANAGWLWKYVDSIQSPADFNKDGYSDIAITSAFADGKTFNLWIFPGGKDGFAQPIFQRTFSANDGWNQAKTKFFTGAADGDTHGDLTMLVEDASGGAAIKQVRGSREYLKNKPLELSNYHLKPTSGWLWKYVDPVR